MKAVALTTIALVAVGCAAKIDQPERPFDVPAPPIWTAATAEAPQATVAEDIDWWDYFEDAGLDVAIREALAHNKDLTAAAARIERAQAQARIAGAPLLPDLGVGLSRTRQRINFIGFPIPGSEPGDVLSTTSTNIGLSLNFNWEVDVWGKLKSAQIASLAEVEAVESDFAGARLSLTGLTAKAWFAAIEARRQLELAESSLESFRESAERVRARFELGVRPSLDLRLALTTVDRTEALVAVRKRELDIAVRQLETLLGKYPAAAYALAEDLPEPPGAVPAGLPSELLHRRPDLIAQERRLLSADAFVYEARMNMRPSFILTAALGTATNQLQNLLSGEVFVWSLVAGLTQPIFNNGRLKAEVSANQAQAREAAAIFENTALGAYREVEVALAADKFLAEQETALRSASSQAAKAQALAEERYRTGLTDIITVLDAQRTAIESESQWLAVRRGRLDNRVDLHLALGGSFSSESLSLADPQPAATGENL